MFNVSGKTARILAAFTAASVACVAAGCSDEDESASLDYEYEDEQMVDDAGNPYTLHRNEDGTETAVYDDGREVTFQRDENNNLNFISGTAGLISDLAMGYFLFHGLQPSQPGYYDKNTGRYVARGNMQPLTKEERDERYRSYGGAGRGTSRAYTGSNSATKPTSDGADVKSSTNAQNNGTSVKSGTKTGFGSAGARSATS